MRLEDITIIPLHKQHEKDALTLVCNQFATGSVLHKAMDISVDEYKTHVQKTFSLVIEEGLSVVALDNTDGSVLGCLLATEFVALESDIKSLPPKFRPIKALLEKLESIYTQSRATTSGRTMLVDLAVVSDLARGRGIYSKLRSVAHEIGRQRQFEYVIGELSSAATQHLCVKKLGHSVKAEVAYADFDYEGAQPFKAIQNPLSIQLVEARL